MENMALLVVDFQNPLVLAKPIAVEEVINNIKRLIITCRKTNVDIVYIQHND